MLFDYFSQPYYLKVINQAKVPSLLGAILTVIIFAVGIALIIKQGDALFYKLRPVVNRNMLFDAIPKNTTLDPSEFFMFSYYFTGNNALLMNKSYFNVDIKNYLLQRYVSSTGEYITNLTKPSLKWEFCGNNSEKYLKRYNANNQNFTYSLKQSGFDNHMCIFDTQLTIGGVYNADFFSNILLEITTCMNSTSNNNTCAPKQDIINVVNGWNLEFHFIDTVIDTNNLTNPYQFFHNQFYVKLDATAALSTDMYFLKNELYSDEGWIFEDIKNQTKVSFDSFREIVTVTPPPGRVLRLYINVSKNRSVTNRFYMKVQELAAMVGGILKVLTILFQGLVSFFCEFKHDELLINMFFDIENSANDSSLKGNSTTSNAKSLFLKLDSKIQTVEQRAGKDLQQTPVQQNYVELDPLASSNISVVQSDNKKRSKLQPINTISSLNKANIHPLKVYAKNGKFSISFAEVFFFKLCTITKSMSLKKQQLEMLLNNLKSFTDYSEVVKSVISFYTLFPLGQERKSDQQIHDKDSNLIKRNSKFLEYANSLRVLLSKAATKERNK